MASCKFPVGGRYVVAGLARKRASLVGEIEATHKRLKEMLAELEHIDATLRIFDPEYPIETIKPGAFHPPMDWANRGEMARTVLSILRQASEPMTGRDIALEMLVSRALDHQDQKLLRLMSKRVGVALRHQRDKGHVQSADGPGQYLLCQIAK